MSVRLWAELVLIIGLVVLNGFFVAAELALITFRRSKLKELAQAGNRRALTIQRLLQTPASLFAATQIGITFVGFLASAVATVIFERQTAAFLASLPFAAVHHNNEVIAIMLVTVAISFVTLVLGEVFPKSLAFKYTEAIGLAVAPVVDVFSRAARPVVWTVVKTSDALLWLFRVGKVEQSDIVTEDEIRAILRAGHEQGILDRRETEMIHGIFELGDTTAREIMVPRIDMTAADADLTAVQAVKLMERTGRSRLPVYRGTIDNIVGIAYGTDVHRAARAGGKGSPLSELARPARFVPESKRLDGLLADFKSWKTHLAIVVDEYGGTAGMVTLEDVLEEVVGDIQDEFDTEEPLYRRLDEKHWRVDARVGIDELNEALDAQFPAEGFETFGGFIYDIFGKVPAAREKIKWPKKLAQWEFTVESVRKRRIIAVRVRRLGKILLTASPGTVPEPPGGAG